MDTSAVREGGGLRGRFFSSSKLKGPPFQNERNPISCVGDEDKEEDEVVSGYCIHV